MQNHTIGIDISKDRLDVHRLPDGTSHAFSNDRQGTSALAKWLSASPVDRIVFEATGQYHQLLEKNLGREGFPLAKVNPRQARRFAEAAGVLAKTDTVDAVILARLGQALAPALSPAPDEQIMALKELHLARHALIKDRTASRNRLKRVTLPLLKRQIRLRLEQIERQLAAVNTEMIALVKANGKLRRQFEILLSIPGIAEAAAMALLAEMPELGGLENKHAASLAGLAPATRQSGKWTGRARIRGGRRLARQALYMPALAACRFNPDLARTYQRLREQGKPSKIAITAVMRKLLVLANALIKKDQCWQPSAC